MDIDRRLFIGGASAIIGCTLSRAGLAEADAARTGKTPMTRKEWDAIIQEGGRANLTCVATAEATEGPFYYESSLLRRDITDRRPGERLRLGITLGGITVSPLCIPLAGAVIDIWQTDATGLYSNVGRDLQLVDTSGQSFLRGHQMTDENGYAEFDTIVPGWEIVPAAPPLGVAMRTTHIHVKAYHGRELLTTQLYFPDALIDQLYVDVEPYKSHGTLTAPGLDRAYPRIRNAQDIFFNQSRAQPMTVERVNGVLTAKATIGMISQGNRGLPSYFR